jgi:hypothetical protein
VLLDAEVADEYAGVVRSLKKSLKELGREAA